jgi:hypothetical protein
MTCDVCNNKERDSDGSRTLSEPVSGDETFKNANISREKYTDPTAIEEMTVDIKGMDEEFTTITDSVSDNNVKKISKNYFVTKGQRINHEMKQNDNDWNGLNTKLKKEIDSALKEEMVIEAQKVKLTYQDNDEMVMVQNFREIGKSWKMDGSIDNAKRINQVAYGVFDSKANTGYEYYLERTIMKKVGLEYYDSNKGRGCIAMMIARRKADLAKGIMKRSEMTHQAKICKKRTGEQTKDEGLRNKKARFAFQIKGNDGNHWCNTYGSMYHEETSTHDEESGKEIELKQKIKDLKLKLSMAKKVFQ